jgi:hypothetical protein
VTGAFAPLTPDRGRSGSAGPALAADSRAHAGKRTLTDGLAPSTAPAARDDRPAPPAAHRVEPALPQLPAPQQPAPQRPHTPAHSDEPTQEQPAALGAWVGAGRSGQIFQHETSDSFVDGATGDSVEVRTDWILAEFESFELGTRAVLACERTIHIQLARGVTLLARSRARAWIHADRLPNDVHAALHAPAHLIKHDGSILTIDDKGAHLLGAFPHPAAGEQSVAALLEGEPLLGFDTEGPQRLREAERFAADTVPQHAANLRQVDALLRDAPHAAVGLTRYIQAKLAYESPDAAPLAVGRHMIQRIEALSAGTWTGYEGTALLFELKAMRAGFAQLVARAELAAPADKDSWDHAADAARAIGKAVVGVGAAVKEVTLMARDLGLWLTDALAHLVGADLDWSAASGLGKAYQAGQSTGEIFAAIVRGLLDAWDHAIEHAANGDYSKLMDLSAELALDLAIGAATAGTTTAGAATTGVGAMTSAQLAGRALALTEQAAAALAGRARAALTRITRTLEAAPAAARRAALDLRDALHGLLDGLATARHLVDAGTGRRLAVLDPGAIPRAIQRVRSARAMESAATAMTNLRGPIARAQGQRVLARLQQLADRAKMPGAIDAVARRIAKGPDKAKLVAALERLLGTWPAQLEPEVLARLLQRTAGAGNPVTFLDDVAWAMTHHGLTPAARAGLLRHAARAGQPLDLRWLRELTDLSAETLEFLALDPATPWMDLMKVSTKPSDYFPSSVRKLLRPSDYAQAAGKLRGIAGELTIAVEGIELPGGLKIVGRQVKTGAKTIDFELQNALGQKAKLEVKAWSPKTWARELANTPRMHPKSRLGRMLEQLRAAKATSEEIYLAVPDSIGPSLKVLRQFLANQKLREIIVIPFSENKLKNTISKLRIEIGLAAGVALVSADQLIEVDDE